MIAILLDYFSAHSATCDPEQKANVLQVDLGERKFWTSKIVEGKLEAQKKLDTCQRLP